jgi:hypothetical protein
METVCVVGCSYLILSNSLGRKQASPLLQAQRVYCYSPGDQDEITALLTKGPFVEQASQQPFKLISVKGTLYLLLPILNPKDLASWHVPLMFTLLACPSKITLLPPSPELQPHCLSLLSSLLQLLSDQCNRSWEVRIVSPDPYYQSQMSALLRSRGYIPPGTGPVTFHSESLMSAFLAAMRCPTCNRIVERPNHHSNSLYCYCHPIADFQIDPLPNDFYLAQSISSEVAVACRCGATVKGKELDRHMLECQLKEWSCPEHRFSGSAEQMFEHYLQNHWEELQRVLPLILSSD